ncbi:hypothetical protein F3168_15265 [Polymorphobacter fuscus]|uniref:Uncharacterized protein n=1 Tax=Sandarakinorhabdus fusca TaxID=1439888 RepID=A0A7C9GTH5_9SPHN|nr:hypothetical protein F9290_15265 [Polymorphobacter fuscus]MQT18611.1 hypothetical protein [Polymorphobacter fuscus]
MASIEAPDNLRFHNSRSYLARMSWGPASASIHTLLALCDQIKTSLADATQTQHHLADAIVEQAAAA